METYFYHYPLYVEKMKKAASFLVGEHDFKSLCSVNTQAETTVRTIYSCNVEKEGDIIKIRVQGNGFLYNMVRTLAGTVLDYAYKKTDKNKVEEMLKTGNRKLCGKTLPAKGLCLESVEY